MYYKIKEMKKRFYIVIKIIDEPILSNRWLYINLHNFPIFCRMLKNHNLTNDLIFLIFLMT